MQTATKILIPIVALLWLVGCGGSSQNATLQSKPHAARSESKWDLGEPKGRASQSAPGRSACDKAMVTRGAHPGEIHFAAQCLGREKGGVIDLVALVHSKGGPRPRVGIIGNRHELRVSGFGGKSRRGVCALGHRVLECSTNAKGHVEIEGVLWVPPATECNSGVSVVNITSLHAKTIFARAHLY